MFSGSSPQDSSRSSRVAGLDAFAGGDYLTAAQTLGSDQWQQWASLAILGRTAGAADALSRSTDPHAGFFAGVAAWMDGDDERAIALLGAAPGEHAEHLARLIATPTITVLAQLPWNRGGSWDMLGAMRDRKFEIINVSFHPGDVQNRPYADARTLMPAGTRPAFYLAEMLEWHLLPPNLRELGCPVIGHSSDYDIHIQAVAPWLPLFDELLVLDRVQWGDMTRIAPHAPVSVYPKVFGIPAHLPGPGKFSRDIDVFFSGTVLDPYHPDKDAIVLELLDLGGARLRIVNGFDAPGDYYCNLAQSKMCVTYVRHPGGLPTRGLEALAMGCVVAVQEENVLRLLLGETSGLVFYGDTAGPLALTIQQALRHWESHAPAARRGAALVRQEFGLSRVASQYLRFATVIAARPRARRVGPRPESLIQKRSVVQRGWLPSNAFGGKQLTQWAAASGARIERQLEDQPSPRLFNDLARERLLASYHRRPDALPRWGPTVIAPLEEAIRRYPAALVPRFNLIRVLLHFGDPAAVRQGLALLDSTITGSLDDWQVDLLDDVLPWDFCPPYFNYRRYFDLVTKLLGGAGPDVRPLIATIMASLFYYRARYASAVPGPIPEIDCAARAVSLDGSFSEYVLGYCRLLLLRGEVEDVALTGDLLRELAGRSARILEILDVARALPGPARGDWYDVLERRAECLWHATEMRELLPEPGLQSAGTEE